MSFKKKAIIRKCIYFVLFGLMIAAFIYLSEKYESNSDVKVLTINDYYEGYNEERYIVVSGAKVINLLKGNEKFILLIGSSKSDYSAKYIEEIDSILKELNIQNIYYYDLNRDKEQKNSNYYEIRNLLEGHLTTTDGSTRNLLAPSLYIVNNKSIEYYNTDTSSMKNTDSADSYWTQERELEFRTEIIEQINKYYLNK